MRQGGQQTRDATWMREAVSLARRGEGYTRPNPPVGAVIVRGDALIARGYHARAGGPHAEISAIRKAGPLARGSTLYVTLEPCSSKGRTGPCTEAIVAAGISRVVVGSRDPNPQHKGRGLRRLRQAGIEVVSGTERATTDPLVRPFQKWVTTGRSFVTLKLAITWDGRIADRNGRSKWITGTAARARVQRLRRQADVIMVGVDTVIADDPLLTSRDRTSQPLRRLVLDSHGRMPLGARMLHDGQEGQTIVATTAACPLSRRAKLRETGATVWVLPTLGGRVSLKALVRKLGGDGMLHVLCEGGGRLAGTLIKADCVDELRLFVAPRVLGRSGVSAVEASGWTLSAAPAFEFVEAEKLGDDLSVVAIPRRRAARAGDARRRKG